MYSNINTKPMAHYKRRGPASLRFMSHFIFCVYKRLFNLRLAGHSQLYSEQKCERRTRAACCVTIKNIWQLICKNLQHKTNFFRFLCNDLRLSRNLSGCWCLDSGMVLTSLPKALEQTEEGSYTCDDAAHQIIRKIQSIIQRQVTHLA